MRKLDEPNHHSQEVFRACCSTVLEPLRSRLLGVEPIILEAVRDYRSAARKGLLHAVTPLPIIGTGDGQITATNMSYLYEGKMVRDGSPGRPFYDELRSSSGGICPYCGQRPVSTLDHFLPKSLFPVYAIEPINLVPACSDCNHNKLDQQATTADELYIHPYFDRLDGGKWLHAQVVHAFPPVVRFFVSTPEHWNGTLKNRVKHQFEKLRLAELYGSNAATMMASIRKQMRNLKVVAGREEVRAELGRRADSAADDDPNSWMTAMYAALAEDDWYINEGLSA